jgi:hypothetical protein
MFNFMVVQYKEVAIIMVHHNTCIIKEKPISTSLGLKTKHKVTLSPKGHVSFCQHFVWNHVNCKVAHTNHKMQQKKEDLRYCACVAPIYNVTLLKLKTMANQRCCIKHTKVLVIPHMKLESHQSPI